LQHLDLTRNHLSGNIPNSIGNIIELKSLSLAENHITGTIPISFGGLVNLKYLDLSFNLLNGTIPVSLSNCTNMETLKLSNNILFGQIPIEFKTNLKLYMFNVSSNMLSGLFPFGIATDIDASDNQLSGNITTLDFDNSVFRLILDHNQFEGTIPEVRKQQDMFITLSLSGNNLTGNIPSSIGKMLSLQHLHLDNNWFMAGVIPENLAGDIPGLYDLSFVNTSLSCPDNLQWRKWQPTACNFAPYPVNTVASSVPTRQSEFFLIIAVVGASLLALLLGTILVVVLWKKRKMQQEYRHISKLENDETKPLIM